MSTSHDVLRKNADLYSTRECLTSSKESASSHQPLILSDEGKPVSLLLLWMASWLDLDQVGQATDASRKAIIPPSPKALSSSGLSFPKLGRGSNNKRVCFCRGGDLSPFASCS